MRTFDQVASSAVNVSKRPYRPARWTLAQASNSRKRSSMCARSWRRRSASAFSASASSRVGRRCSPMAGPLVFGGLLERRATHEPGAHGVVDDDVRERLAKLEECGSRAVHLPNARAHRCQEDGLVEVAALGKVSVDPV